MKYRFVLGIARGGTSFIADLLHFTTSKIKYVGEPFPRTNIEAFNKTNRIESWTILPSDNIERLKLGCKLFKDLASDNNSIRSDIIKNTIYREDDNFEFLFIKEVHNLLNFDNLIKGLDYKGVVIFRNTLRILDSYFSGLSKKQRTYLVDEYIFLVDYVKKNKWKLDKIDEAFQNLKKDAVNNFSKNKLINKSLIRQCITIEFVKQYTLQLTQKNDTFIKLNYEDLCINPLKILKVYDFFDFQYNEQTIEKIKEMTTGTDSGYFDTKKNSLEILHQDYKYLKKNQIRRLQNLIN